MAFVIQNSGAYELLQGRTHNTANEIDGGADDFQTLSGTDWANVSYDKNGNTTVAPKPSALGSGYTLTYDAWNRLVTVKDGAATVATYAYDGLNRRVTKNSSGTLRHFYYSDQWQVVEERIGADPDPANHYVWGLRYVDDLLLRDRDTAAVPDGTFDQRHYYLQDANWNVTAITNQNGDVQERYEYDPYGQVSYLTASWGASSSSFANPYAFTGRRRDDETGLYYYRNRYYHAQLGRFVSRDPIGYEGGWNLYGYVRGNPIRRGDPTGLNPVDSFCDSVEGCCIEVLDKKYTCSKESCKRAMAGVAEAARIATANLNITNNGVAGGACHAWSGEFLRNLGLQLGTFRDFFDGCLTYPTNKIIRLNDTRFPWDGDGNVMTRWADHNINYVKNKCSGKCLVFDDGFWGDLGSVYDPCESPTPPLLSTEGARQWNKILSTCGCPEKKVSGSDPVDLSKHILMTGCYFGL